MAARGDKLIIGQRLKILRTTLGLTQAQMAAQLDVSASYITLIESDQRPASAKLLMRLAQVYDLNVAELAPDTDAQLAADFEAALKDTRASVTEAMERDYEKIQGEIKQQAMSVNPIGFFAPGMLKPVREQKHGDDTVKD